MKDLDILFEDDDYVAVSKPAGIVVHHDARHTSGTVADWALARYPEIKSVGEDSERPGIVHRLDKDTSGVLLVAKTKKSFTYFKKLFQAGKIRKTYLALVVGVPKNDVGVINAPIARSTKNFQKRVVGGEQGRSREAITEYRMKERLGEYTLLEVMPRTGRTHQIRSHLAHIGCPVACDALYGGKRFMCPAGLERQFLHAYSVEFRDLTGRDQKIIAPLSADLEMARKELRK